MAGVWVLKPRSKWDLHSGALGRDWKRNVFFPGIGRKFFCKCRSDSLEGLEPSSRGVLVFEMVWKQPPLVSPV